MEPVASFGAGSSRPDLYREKGLNEKFQGN